MLRSNVLSRTLAALLCVAVFAVSALADTIRLKDGSIIKGRIVGFADGRFIVEIGQGDRRRELSFSAAEVESISFDSPMASNTRPVGTMSNTQTSNGRVSITETGVGVGARRVDPVPVPNRTQERVIIPHQPETEPTRANDPAPQSSVPVPVRSASTAKPIEVSVKVLADATYNGWTNSGWVVKKGQRIKITGGGQVSLGGGRTSPAGGVDELEDSAKLLPAVPTGALIAVIGDDNNEFIYIGGSREFVAKRDGALFLGVNEGNLNDNSGSFDVKIEIFPDGN